MSDAERVARDLFRVLETGDVDLARRTVAPDNHNREAVAGPPACSIPGPAGTLASSAWLRTAFPDLRFDVLGIAEGPDEAWVRLRMQGRHDGPFVRYRDGRQVDVVVPPTHHDVDFEQVHVLRLLDGLVASHEAVRDDVTMLDQLGVLPPDPRTLARIGLWRGSGRARRAARQVEAAAEAAGVAA